MPGFHVPDCSIQGGFGRQRYHGGNCRRMIERAPYDQLTDPISFKTDPSGMLDAVRKHPVPPRRFLAVFEMTCRRGTGRV